MWIAIIFTFLEYEDTTTIVGMDDPHVEPKPTTLHGWGPCTDSVVEEIYFFTRLPR